MIAPAKTAAHRPAVRRRRNKHDTLVAVDLFSGFGGLTQGIERAGFDVIMAANHNPYKVSVHEANHPETEHWVANLVDTEAADYHSARDLPAGDLLTAGVSCVNHSVANTKRAYAQGLSLFDVVDEEYEKAVTRSERDRATANCVLHYAAQHHPRLILVECTTELQSWGPLLPGSKKIGDGTTYRWWLKQFELLGYRYRVLYLNSMFFGVPQSRDRLYIAVWDRKLPTPDLDHRPPAWCGKCGEIVEARWSWKTGVPPSGTVRYGVQYNYRCPRCHGEALPPATASLHALDLTNLGTRIGDRKRKLAAATEARAQRCMERFAEFPAVLMPAKATRGSEKHIEQPMATQTSQQETALLSTGAVVAVAGNTYEHPGSTCRTRDLSQPLPAQTATNSQALMSPPVALSGHVMPAHRHNGDGKNITAPMDTVTTTPEKAVLVAVHNYQGAPRGVDQALPTQTSAETLSLLSADVVPFKHTIPTGHGEPMPTQTADQIPGLLTAGGLIKHNGDITEAKYRSHPLSDPLGAVVASGQPQGVLFGGWIKNNGTRADQFPAPHPLSDPLGTLTSRDTTGLLTAEWHAMLADLRLEDCYLRMLASYEIGRGCGFDVNFPGYQGTFICWGSERDQTDGFGNAVSPPVGWWIGGRLRAVLHGEPVAA